MTIPVAYVLHNLSKDLPSTPMPTENPCWRVQKGRPVNINAQKRPLQMMDRHLPRRNRWSILEYDPLSGRHVHRTAVFLTDLTQVCQETHCRKQILQQASRDLPCKTLDPGLSHRDVRCALPPKGCSDLAIEVVDEEED